jgi:hypothetical protein
MGPNEPFPEVNENGEVSSASESKTMPKQSRDKVGQPQCHQICQELKNQQIKICIEKETLMQSHTPLLLSR